MNTQNALEQAEALTRDILTAAIRDDWDTVTRLEAQRMPLITMPDGQKIRSEKEKREVRGILERIEAANRQTADLARQRYAEIGLLLKALEKRPDSPDP